MFILEETLNFKLKQKKDHEVNIVKNNKHCSKKFCVCKQSKANQAQITLPFYKCKREMQNDDNNEIALTSVWATNLAHTVFISRLGEIKILAIYTLF